jgi:GNAT superfamily N-acetyltransferase
MSWNFNQGNTKMTFQPGTKRVMMLRPDLHKIPHHPLPSPYTIDWYKEGDEHQWLAIKAQSDRFHTADLAYFIQTYSEHRALLSQRQMYLYDAGGKAVGTVTAWFEKLAGKTYGKINWMLLAPEVQGLGLSKALLSLSLQRLGELGHTQALLYTLTARIAAINLYRQFGFVPLIGGGFNLEAWDEVNFLLKKPFSRDEYIVE